MGTLDIASYIGCSVTDDQKFKLIEHRMPEKSFKFPGKKYKDVKRKDGVYMRYCNLHWLT